MANEGTRLYRFGDDSIDAPADMNIQEVREIWSEVHSGLENAEAIENDDGSVTFRQRGGSKGC